MPRNSNGVMSLPAGNPVVTGTVIESDWANPTMADIANELTWSLPRNGSAAMTGPLILARDGILPNEAVTVKQLDISNASSTNALPAGTVMQFATVNAPTGWLKCNGQAVSRTTYANLFAVIGSTYGAGNGTTTFNVPDFRGEFIRGLDEGRGVDPGRALGAAQAGRNHSHVHTAATSDHFHTADHTHNAIVNDPGHIHNSAASTTWVAGDKNQFAAKNQSQDNVVATGVAQTGITVGIQTASLNTSSTYAPVDIAAEGVADGRPRNQALCYCIKAFGTLTTGGLGTMAFQNSNAVSISGGSITVGSLRSTTAPVQNNDVVRLVDLQNIVAGSGSVSGPPISTNDGVARWDGATGKLLKNGPLIQTSPSDSTPGRLLTVGATLSTLGSGIAPLASPAFSGTPTAPNPSAGDSSGRIATTLYVQNALTAANIPTLNPSVVVVTNPSGVFVSSSTSTTELGRLSGVTGNIQTQLDGKAPLVSPALTGVPTAPTAAVGTNTTQVATTAFVLANAGSGGGGGLPVFPASRGIVSDASGALVASPASAAEVGFLVGVSSALQTQLNSRAPIASPALTGVPTAPTAAVGTNTTQVATTAFVLANAGSVPTLTANRGIVSDASGALAASNVTATEIGHLSGVSSAIQTQLNSRAPLASPALTGVPTGPTAPAGTNTTQLATTAFVLANAGGGGSLPTFSANRAVITNAGGEITVSSVTAAQIGHLSTTTANVQTQIDSRAPLASPALTGVPTAPTAAVGTNTTQVATTAFVLANAGSGGGGGDVTGPNGAANGALALFDGTTGKILQAGVLASTLAPLANPALTGNPTAPTQAAGNNSTRLATTAFIANAISTVYRQNNILAPVGMTSGVPNGGIIEVGSNANGRFVRFADGTQICYRAIQETGVPINTAAGALFMTGSVTWTNPANFVPGNITFIGAAGTTTHNATKMFVTPISAGATQITYSVQSTVSQASASVWVYLVAIGRWAV